MRQWDIQCVLLQLGILLAAFIDAGFGFFRTTMMLGCAVFAGLNMGVMGGVLIGNGKRMGTGQHVATKQPRQYCCVPRQTRTHRVEHP